MAIKYKLTTQDMKKNQTENSFVRPWDEIEYNLGHLDHNMSRQRPYNGQPHTNTGMRGATEIRGITFRDLRDCFIRAVCLSAGYIKPAHYEEATKGEQAALCENDLYGFDFNKLDPMAICQNLSCEIERAMEIFPNVPKHDAEEEVHKSAPVLAQASQPTSPVDLKRFAQQIFELADWPYGSGIDGGAIQDVAVECGLLVPETRYEPCGENCSCAEYYNADDIKVGITCYRKRPEVFGEEEQ